MNRSNVFQESRARRVRISLAVVFPLLFCLSRAWAIPPSHPLDGLTEEEHWTIREVIRAAERWDDDTRIMRVLLREPPKQQVLAWQPGQRFARQADLVLRSAGQTFEAVVDLQQQRLVLWQQVTGVHAGEILDDLIVSLDALVKSHPQWQAAMRKRGITDQATVLVGPISPAFSDVPAGDPRRLVKVAGFDRRGTYNLFGRPIAGLIAIVDLDHMEVLKVIDSGVVPLPKGPVDYHANSVGKLREAPAPLRIDQPRGPGFQIDGHEVAWQNWRFHFRIDPRVGLVVSRVHYVDGGKPRSILYQGHLSELFVPYMDSTMGWRDRAYLDLAETAGGIAVPLEPGIDGPDYATYFDAVVATSQGIPKRIPRAACLFELDPASMAWRHRNLISNLTEGRTSRQLVLRMIATLGNYDYVFDWVFCQDGAIHVRIGSTGVDQAKAVLARDLNDARGRQDAAFGRFVAPHTVAVNHDHYFCFRLDLDVDGVKNSFLREGLKVVKPPQGLRKIWVLDPQVAQTELDARMRINMTRPALWRIINPHVAGSVGNSVSYQIRPRGGGQSLVTDEDYPGNRGGFTRYHLWITPLNSLERYADGKYPFRSRPDGLAQWTEQDRPIENADIVAWLTIGFHHVVRTEDWPIMPTKWDQFEIRPYNFFERNPSLDLPK